MLYFNSHIYVHIFEPQVEALPILFDLHTLKKSNPLLDRYCCLNLCTKQQKQHSKKLNVEIKLNLDLMNVFYIINLRLQNVTSKLASEHN